MSGPSDSRGEEPTLAAAASLPVSVTDPTQAGDAPNLPTASPSVAGELARGDRIGRFEVSGKLGAGGMGVVYLAEDPELGRKLAIKLVRGRADGSAGDADRARLQREAQAMAKVTHANLVTVYDVGQHDGQVFIAMEYVAGGTIREWLSATTRPWTEIVEKFAAAGRGLAAAHDAGIVHRDFKPDNALVATDGTVKVLDFGLAVGSEQDPSDASEAPTLGRSDPLALRLTQTGALLGTPAYMSPEQHHGRSADARSDQFSFGVALFEALYGRRPFAGETMAALVHAVLSHEIVETPRGDVPRRIDAAIRRALSVDPDDRFPRMGGLLDELTTPVHPPPATRSRGPLLAVGVGAVAIMGLVGWVVMDDAPVRSDGGAPTPAPAIPAPNLENEEAKQALLSVLLAPNDVEKGHRARAYLDAHGDSGGKARRVIAEGVLGTVLWRRACANEEQGLCLTFAAPEPDASLCTRPARGRVSANTRDETLQTEARDHLDAADRLADGVEPPADEAERRAFVDTIATVRTQLADERLEGFLAQAPPRSLSWQSDPKHEELSTEAFAGFWARAMNDAQALVKSYARIHETGSDYWAVVAAARTGTVYEHLSDAVISIPIPETMRANADKRANYCDAVMDKTAPLGEQATGSFAWCSTRATELGLSSDLIALCDDRLRALSKLDSAEIRRIIRANLQGVRACYTKLLESDPEAKGRVVTRFTIAAGGTVSAASTTEESDLPDGTNACVANAFKAIEFPDPGPLGVSVTYPLDFAPG